MKIGILGGTFNPIHKGHIEIAKTACENLGLGKVIFIPNGIPPHKKSSSISNEDKLNMLNISLLNYPHFFVDTFEIDKNDTSYLYLTLEYLRKKYPFDELYFIAGSDNIDKISGWKNPEELFKYANFVFVKRPEYELDKNIIKNLEETYNANISVIDFYGIDISSSCIREAFENFIKVEDKLPSGVFSYIAEHAVYPCDKINKLKEKLDDKRFIHSKNVAFEAYKLAKVYNEDCEKAYYAGLLHDCAKKIDLDEQLDLINKFNTYPLMENELSYPKVLHALTGSIIAKREFNVSDREILDAIRFHTLGNKNMTLLSKIIYIADLISSDRLYKGVEILREMAYNNIDKAILMSIENTILYLGEDKVQTNVLELRDYIKENL